MQEKSDALGENSQDSGSNSDPRVSAMNGGSAHLGGITTGTPVDGV